LVFLLTAAAFLWLGWGISARLWRDGEEDAPDTLERLTATIIIAFGAWLAIDWALALTHTFTPVALYLRTLVIAGAAALGLRGPRVAVRFDRLFLWAIVPLALWSAFMLWRGAVLPPLSHDALANHLPRAVMFSRFKGFEDLTLISPAFKDMPANYELLLADTVTMLSSDGITEWLSTILYVTLAVAGGALASRWWRNRWSTMLTMLLLAAMPVALLHAGAHKNDLLVATFLVSALVFGGRYWSTGDYRALLLLGASMFIAVGTKNQSAAVGAALLPFVAWRMVSDLRARRLRMRAVLGAFAFAIAGFTLLGGYSYFDHYLRDAPAATGANAWLAARGGYTSYGDWANLWQGPYLMIAAPFAPTSYQLRVPWDDDPWFWRRYEIYFAHFGIPFALCMLAAPFLPVAWRGGPRRSERRVVFIAAIIALLAQLPAYLRPHGVYIISLGRYAMFFAAPVLAWTLGAVVTKTPAKHLRVLAIAAAGFFSWYAVEYAMRDRFAPLEFALLMTKYPGSRYIPFDPYRATSRLDNVAGPDDLIAVDAAWQSWIHPLFGRDLTRPVYFIRPGPGPVRFPRETKWVVVERAFAVIWGSSKMKSAGDAGRFFHQHTPTQEELRVVNALMKDPRFKLVWADRRRNQAIFQRVRP
jgi:hypothetical protein